MIIFRRWYSMFRCGCKGKTYQTAFFTSHQMASWEVILSYWKFCPTHRTPHRAVASTELFPRRSQVRNEIGISEILNYETQILCVSSLWINSTWKWNMQCNRPQICRIHLFLSYQIICTYEFSCIQQYLSNVYFNSLTMILKGILVNPFIFTWWIQFRKTIQCMWTWLVSHYKSVSVHFWWNRNLIESYVWSHFVTDCCWYHTESLKP